MFCPVCRGEYREGFTYCHDCDVALVAELPRDPEIVDGEFASVEGSAALPDGDLVRVFATSEAALIPVVESLFRNAGIAVMTKGEPIQDFFALGRLFGANPMVGPVEFFVRPDQVEEAEELLDGIGEPLAEGAENPEQEAPES